MVNIQNLMALYLTAMVKKIISFLNHTMQLKLNTLVHSLSFCELSVQDITYASVSSVLVYCYHPPSPPVKPYIISEDMAWWSQPQLELDDLKLTIWGNHVFNCWYCYELSQLLRLIMVTYVLHSFDLHWLTFTFHLCHLCVLQKGSLTWIQLYYCGYWKD